MSTGENGIGLSQALEKNRTTISDWIRALRNRLLASARFRRIAARVPGTRYLANRHANNLFRLTAGFVHSQVLAALVELEVLQRLKGENRSLAEIAAATGVAPDRLQPIMQAGQSLGLTHERSDGSWTLGDHGVLVANDGGLEAMIRHHAMLYEDLRHPAALARGNSSQTRLSHYWAYAGDRRQNYDGDEIAAYSQLMAESQAMLSEEILDAYAFGRHSTLLDVGGGSGAFLARAGERHGQLSLKCFDLPAVIARTQGYLAEQKLTARIQCFGGNFFTDELPRADIISLIRIVCDHDDGNVLRLLTNIRRGMRSDDRLLIAEAMRSDGVGQSLAAAYFDLYFLAMGSGKCRTPRQLGELLNKAGFSSHSLHWCNTRLLAGIIVAKP